MQKDYFSIAHKGYRAIAWIFMLAFVWGILSFISESYGGTPSLTVTLFVVQFAVELVLCLITARLFRNKSHFAVTMGYVTLVMMVIFAVLLFSAKLTTVVGILSAVIFVYLLVTTVMAQKQARALKSRDIPSLSQ